MSSAASPYSFHPLPDGWIRLLQLMPDEIEHAPIRCQLLNYRLLDSGRGTHLYEALSYVWGSPKKPQVLFIDDDYIRITENLHAALQRLRDPSLPRIIWIDAVCINQDDPGERAHQVKSMAKIYAKASRVVVWLEEATTGGEQADEEATSNSDRALELLCIAAAGQPTGPLDKKLNQQAVLVMLQQQWFRRMWVGHLTSSKTGKRY